MKQKTDDANAEADKRIDDDAQDWFVLVKTGDPSDEERQKFHSWREADPRHSAAYDELEAVWTGVESLRVNFEPNLRSTSPDAETPGNLLRGGRRRGHPESARSRLVAWGSLAAAVAVFAVFLGPSIALQIEADHLTRAGEQDHTTLPDGSVAWLNTDTAIAIDFSDQVRRVSLLKGEAQFDVSPDQARPFVVDTVYGTATAVGTIFTVRKLERASAVTVVEGIVDVEAFDTAGVGADVDASSLAESERVYLRPRQGVSPVETVTLSSANAWREGYVSIQDLPVDQALAELDRYRPGRILLMASEDQSDSITARVAINTIDDGLNAIAASIGLSVIRVTDYLAIVR